MKSKLVAPIFTFVLIFVMLFNMVGTAVDAFSYNMEKLPKGKYLSHLTSPDGETVLCLYLVDIKNIGSAIRGEVVSVNEAGEKQEKTIYWETGTKSYIASFVDSNTVIINDHEVNINGTPYDSRTQIELPEASAKNRMQ